MQRALLARNPAYLFTVLLLIGGEYRLRWKHLLRPLANALQHLLQLLSNLPWAVNGAASLLLASQAGKRLILVATVASTTPSSLGNCGASDRIVAGPLTARCHNIILSIFVHGRQRRGGFPTTACKSSLFTHALVHAAAARVWSECVAIEV